MRRIGCNSGGKISAMRALCKAQACVTEGRLTLPKANIGTAGAKAVDACSAGCACIAQEEAGVAIVRSAWQQSMHIALVVAVWAGAQGTITSSIANRHSSAVNIRDAVELARIPIQSV